MKHYLGALERHRVDTWIANGLLLLVVIISSHGRVCHAQQSFPNLLAAINAHPNLTVVAQLVQKTGLDTILAANNSATALLPTDKAFEAFAPTDALLSLDVTALRKLLLFHIVDDAMDATVLSLKNSFIVFSWLRQAYKQPTSFTIFTANYVSSLGFGAPPGPGNFTVFGRGSSSATAVETDIVVNNGRSYVHLINNVLAFWYTSVSEALTYTGSSDFQAALQLNGLLNLLESGTTASPYNIFAPGNDAIAAAKYMYGAALNLSVASTVSKDFLSYYISNTSSVQQNSQQQTTPSPDFTQPGTYTLYSLSGDKLKIDATTSRIYAVTETFENASIWPFVQLPVGGLIPTAYVSSFFPMLIPVPVTIYKWLTSQTATYSVLLDLLNKNPRIRVALASPNSSITLLAPSDAAFSAFLRKYHYSSLDEFLRYHDRNASQMLLENHIISGARTLSTFKDGERVVTQRGDILVVKLIGNSVMFSTKNDSASVVPQVKDVSIFYGRSYVQMMDFPLIPSTLMVHDADDISGGGSSTALPSLILLAVTILMSIMTR
ncbi:hypothetical protein VaNZ11_014164, partial [Volvox africanus]